MRRALAILRHRPADVLVNLLAFLAVMAISLIPCIVWPE